MEPLSAPCKYVIRMLLAKAKCLNRLYFPKTSINIDDILTDCNIISPIKKLTLRATNLTERSIEALSQLAHSLEELDIAGCHHIGNNGKIT